MKLPVYMINGFLGSGKTTVLLNMIEECKSRGLRTGIILNELGKTNIEEEYFEGFHLKQLLNGCICCTIQDDLKDALRSFIGEEVDVLFIEGTGVANPIDIEDALNSPEFIEAFQLYSMISVVDGSSFLEYQNVFSSSKEIRKLLNEQISSASMVIFNKTDLSKEKLLLKAEEKIKRIVNEHVPVYFTSYGKVEERDLLKKRYMTSRINTTKPHHHDERRHNHSTIRAIQMKEVPQIDRLELHKWILQLPKEVLRGKGIIALRETPGLFHIQFASGNLQIERAKGTKMDPTIILIGDQLNEEALNKDFREYFM